MLTSNERDLTWDAGIWRWASIGNFAWHDLDGDGSQDAGELGINGVTVRLLDSSGAVVGTTTTANDPVGGAPGWYLFDDLDPAIYSIEFDLASTVLTTDGFVATGRDEGATDLVDSDANLTTGRTIQTQLTSNENDPTWDAGFYIPVDIGDYVWYDSDLDGLLDAGDENPDTNIQGINGVTVRLLDGAGAVVATTTTADNPVGGAPGWYLFADLRPGTYEVEFVLPTGFSFSPVDIGGDDAIDSDADRTTGRTGTFAVTSGIDDFTRDAGMYEFAGLGDFVWDDLDADGLQDPGEPGIGGVTVWLRDIFGAEIASTTTAPDGSYRFDRLVPGTYSVRFDLSSPALVGYQQSPLDSFNPTIDSNAGAGGVTPSTVLDLDEYDPTIDAGFYRPATIGNFVWDDLDGDGIQDLGEPGIESVRVFLLDGAGNRVPDGSGGFVSDTTDVDGLYEFTGLVPGDYSVQFDLTSPALAGYVQTPTDTGANDAIDSDQAPDGTTPTTTLTSGENDATFDAGFYIPVVVGNFVWEDRNGDGVQGAGEPGVPGVTVYLLDGSGARVPDGAGGDVSTITDANGSYEFTGLAPGAYGVQFDLATVPAGLVPTRRDAGGDDALDSDADAAGITPITSPLASGAVDRTLDLGLVVPVVVGDFVWEDRNGNGIQDAGEPGIGGVGVELFLDDPVLGLVSVGTTTTTTTGAYQFIDLDPGSYVVEFDLSTLPAGMVATVPNATGADDAADSDADPTSGRTAATPFLFSRDSDLTLDLGAYVPVRVGDRVWNDLDGDGVQDAGEPGVGNVRVFLLDGSGARIPDGSGGDVSTTTGADGSYEFAGLRPGAYAVQFDLASLPPGAVATFLDQGADDAVDSDADRVSGTTAPTPLLPSGASDLTLDLGIYVPVRVGDRVWDDLDGDGVQDAGEPGVPDVGVTLFLVDPVTGDPVEIASTTTDGSGIYDFADLAPGAYFVEFDLATLPTDAVVTFRDQGATTGSTPMPTARRAAPRRRRSSCPERRPT